MGLRAGTRYTVHRVKIIRRTVRVHTDSTNYEDATTPMQSTCKREPIGSTFYEYVCICMCLSYSTGYSAYTASLRLSTPLGCPVSALGRTGRVQLQA